MQLKIYLSSTFQDLEHYREVVYHRLRELRHDVLAMEDYVAADTRPVDRCLADVRGSDIYMGLFAWRYGYVPLQENPERLSITELELREAERNGKPCLLFVLKPTVPWPPAMMDTTSGENEGGARITALRAKLQQDRLVGLFSTPDELGSKAVTALYRWQMESFASPADVALPAGASRQARARADHPLLWENGSRLRVRFLDGETLLIRRVLRMARMWSAYANVELEHSDAADAEVRVSFKGLGSWSYEGSHSLVVAQDQPTLNLGGIAADTPLDEFEAVVLHEFGHALGLAHEHTNPDANIPWNREACYAQMGAPPNNWSRQTVDQMFFQTWAADRFPLRKPFDPHSLMAFPVPAELTTSGLSIDRNLALSPGDKEFISRLYPYAANELG